MLSCLLCIEDNATGQNALSGHCTHFWQVRITLDNLGAHAIKVIPCLGDVLHGSVAAALDLPEPAWEEPKPAEAARSGDWGSQRTVLFSGLE